MANDNQTLPKIDVKEFDKLLRRECAGDFARLAELGYWRWRETRMNPMSNRFTAKADEIPRSEIARMPLMDRIFYLFRYVMEASSILMSGYDTDFAMAWALVYELLAEKLDAADIAVSDAIFDAMVVKARESLLEAIYTRQMLAKANVISHAFENTKVN